MTPTLLLILDGWGLAAPGPGNAPYLAPTPHLDSLNARCPHARLMASGRAVGLPEGYMGNSEVGHLNIGAGRVVYQDMTRIDVALEEGSFAANPVLGELLAAVKKSGGRLHLAGLLSDGGVHSHIRHLEAICDMAARADVPVRIHAIMDGRDTDPKSGVGFARALEEHIKNQPRTRIVDLVGRFYAMDRDKRWERVKAAWDLLARGQSDGGRVAPDAVAALEASYAEGVTDEFVKPVLCAGGRGASGAGEPAGMADGDALFLFNFRADRMRELTQAFIEPDFRGFERGAPPRLAGVASMTSYEASFGIPVAFPKEAVTLGLGEAVSRAGLRQLRLAETEKYAHVTYFFNGGVEEPFPGEDRILVPSPRDVPTYDRKPAMSARQVTDRFVEAWNKGIYDLVVCNLANGDMVGHTGVLEAAVEACAVVDECVGRMVSAVEERGGRMLIIADHGNCEVMLTPEGRPHTAHTTNAVPCILLEPDGALRELGDGRLADVAPTLLGLWGLKPPASMTGRNLTGGEA
ncbi:2,3-bisphosphoglycerate-independent phosphoglycerate mutase [Desulfovibrio sp. SGI.169]|uniref:2,3-bisphosphoglycerate-independent phosphoglycerate mutase n=1 Tax=Desulfovibrio sp. SGI.169 TaxID=3420561 RepID=UPI003D082C3F